MDTGIPAGTPEEQLDETSAAYTGRDLCSCAALIPRRAMRALRQSA